MLLFIFHIQLKQLHQIVDLCINFRHLLGNRVFGPTFNFFPVDYNVLAFGFVFFQELLDALAQDNQVLCRRIDYLFCLIVYLNENVLQSTECGTLSSGLPEQTLNFATRWTIIC